MRGGKRPGAGRPHGATTRLPAAEVAAALDDLRQPGETWAALARRLGVARQTIDRARRSGVSERVLMGWRGRRE